MNIYQQKQRWKLLLLGAAIFIAVASLWYTNKLVKELSVEEHKKVALWAQGTKQLANLSEDMSNLNFAFEVIKDNTTVPVILTDENDSIISYRNLDSVKATHIEYLRKQLQTMKSQHKPIDIALLGNQKNFIYYKDSILLTQLRYYPFFQLAVISLFLLVSYFAFSASRKAEQNQVWIGMAKETAHQLGTPLSSLIAWIEFLKLKGIGIDITNEIEKDVHRLNTITERFSKIGAAPKLQKENLNIVLQNAINYIKSRTSGRVVFSIQASPDIFVPLNIPLFEWVIENLCKNAIDAMNGEGKMSISVTDQQQYIYVDFTDTGKGIAKSKFKTIFKPGFTTKNRGWGLGLSLSKKIIEQYHSGEIFVKQSESGKGATLRIVLKKQSI